MSVRKRLWTTRLGERKEAWIVDYVDGQGDRHIKTFTRKKDADAEAAKVKVDVGLGIHTAPSKSITVAAAAEDWIRFVTLEKREAATIAGYRQHVDKHIVPRLGATSGSATTCWRTCPARWRRRCSAASKRSSRMRGAAATSRRTSPRTS